MKAFLVTSHDAPPAIVATPTPAPGPGEVLVRVAAAGLNFADLLMAGGTYQDTPPTPFALGLEYAGTVEAHGPGADGPPPGTRVAVYRGFGGLAEYATAPADRCLPIPDSMSFEEAAGFQIAYATSHLALDHLARLREGETLLVLGAAGGVGLTAVEIGRIMGARVIACARGAEKLAAAAAAGAHHLLDSETADIREEVKALGGADVVYDPVGGAQFTAAFRATRPRGRILVIGFASGTVPPIPANHLLVKNVSVMGLNIAGYLGFAPEILRGSLSTLLDWYGQGRIRPTVSHVLPFAEAAAGLDLIRRRQATGKVVVRLRD